MEPDSPTPRLDSIDILRGLAIVLMALDHTRDYFGYNPRFQPDDLAATTPAWFFTRWVTHFCAPAFVFLAGTSAYLYAQRHGRGGLSRFLVARGVWLILLEFTLARFGWTFDVTYSGPFAFVFLQVIWAIGVSMIVLAALVRLPLWAIAVFGIALMAGHNLLDGINPPPAPPSQGEGHGHGGPHALAWYWTLWLVLHEGWSTFAIGRIRVEVIYPLVPWIGVMAAGYAFGRLVTIADGSRRRRTLLALGLGLTAAFLCLRAGNIYGDPEPWVRQDRGPVFTGLSFLRTSKYPPSLLFLLMTLGPAIAALPLLESARGRLAGFFRTFGRVPLFFYILHIPVIHAAALAAALAIYGRRALEFGPHSDLPEGYTPRLWAVYLAWTAAVSALYPVCRWFAAVKRRRRNRWLSYL